jgi:hypothetical protein
MTASVLSVTNASLLRLTVFVEDSDWEGFDRLEVWRSVLGEAGPYEEISGKGWLPAVLPYGALEPSPAQGAYVNVVGKKLQLLLNEAHALEVTFTGVDPIRLSDVATQISQLGYVQGYVDTNGKLAVRTLQAGGNVALRIVGGDAAPLLGLSNLAPDSLGFGTDPRPVLLQGQRTYTFVDYWSQPGYFYKTRFSNSLSGVKSAFANAVSANASLVVAPSKIAMGYVKLLQNNGRPAATQEVTVYSSYTAALLDGATILGGPEKFLTDASGYAEFPLLRGISVDVGVGGSSVVRRVTVPTDPNVLKFNVFDPAYGQDDSFAVVRADLPYAQRTEL